MPIRYKIIRNPERTSAYAYGPYSISYPKGVKVTAPANTLGLFVYARRKDAEAELDNDFSAANWDDHKIIRVNALGRGKKLLIRPSYYGPSFIAYLGDFKKEILQTRGKRLTTLALRSRVKKTSTWDGTMVYDAIIPLD